MTTNSIVKDGKTIRLETPAEAIKIIEAMDSTVDLTLLRPGAEAIIAANPGRMRKGEQVQKEIIIVSLGVMKPMDISMLETIRESFLAKFGHGIKPEVLLLLKRVAMGLCNGMETPFTGTIDELLQKKVVAAVLNQSSDSHMKRIIHDKPGIEHGENSKQKKNE